MTLILGIETSCDETAAAVVRDGRLALSNVIASQHDLHEEYGGVVPELASRAHLERLLPVVRAAMREADARYADLDAVAVGNRPGLIGALLVGVAGAKALAWSLGKPIIGVDHLEAHLYAPMLSRDAGGAGDIVWPALGLVVSGGHTSLYRCASALELAKLGGTIDDAVGEAYDKVAALLGLGHPGGPRVDALAQTGDDRAHQFPLSRLEKDSLDFSFSGLKTAVLYAARGQPERPSPGEAPRFLRDGADLSEGEKADVCASFQRAAVRNVMLRLERAMERWPREFRTLLVGGGVSANSRLRAELATFAARYGLALRIPAMEFCLDNAAMIAGLAHERLIAGLVDDLTLAASPTTSR
ncbi:MAG: tRNA (adenosine(37)-N6)-threonylcarbamoyltransferase complex transferase subunit TsaD [Phycisphaerales bacterium]|nr:tRNA (adenosine(37)-N6)-threonylcarbamoyltransferase complex transferase subunit TsaD [Phycisphaerales bacterium]